MAESARAGNDTMDAGLGTATVSGLSAITSYVSSFYDSTNGQMVMFEVVSDLGSPTTIQTGDCIRLIVKIIMSPADYTNFASGEPAFQDLP